MWAGGLPEFFNFLTEAMMSKPFTIGNVAYLSSQSAAIPQTTLISNSLPGMLRLNYYINLLQAPVGTGTFDLIVGWTDDFGNQRYVTIPLSVTQLSQGSLPILSGSSSNLSYQVEVSGFSTNPIFNISLCAERLSGDY